MNINEILKEILPELIDGGDCEDVLSNHLKRYSKSERIVLEMDLRQYLWKHNYLAYVELIEGECVFCCCDDIFYLRVNRDYDYDVSDDTRGVIVDFDIDGEPVALEILSASRFFKLTAEELENISGVILKVNVNEDVIKFALTLEIDEVRHSFEEVILNEYGASEGCHVYRSVRSFT